MNTKTKEALTSKALNKRGGASKSILYLDWRLPMEILTKKELSHTLWGNIKKERGKTDSKIIRKQAVACIVEKKMSWKEVMEIFSIGSINSNPDPDRVFFEPI